MSKKNFEETMAELEDVVEALEEEEVSLEDALKKYEKGIQLIRNCQEFLDKAEGKFKALIGDDEKVLNLKEATPAALEDLEKN